MAYLNKSVYTLYYINIPLLKVTDIHHGLGWLSGKYNADKHFEEYYDFLSAYSKLEDYYGGDQSIWDQEILKLGEHFGNSLVLETNWHMHCNEDNSTRELSVIPFIDESSHRISWRE